LSTLFQFMVVTYILNTAWLAMTFFCAMPIIIYIMVRSVCKHEIELRDYWYLDNYCLNLTRFGKNSRLQEFFVFILTTFPLLQHFVSAIGLVSSILQLVIWAVWFDYNVLL